MSDYDFTPSFDEFSDVRRPLNRASVDDSNMAGVGAGKKNCLALLPLTGAGSLADAAFEQGLTLDTVLAKFGHIAYLMCLRFFTRNPTAELDAIAIAEAAGTAAAGTVTFATAADVTGEATIWLGDYPVKFDITSGDTPAQVNAAMIAAIQADALAPFTAVVDGVTPEECDLTYDFKGLLGNYVKVKVDLPDGIATTATVVDATGGATDPTIDDTYTALYKARDYRLIHPTFIGVENDVNHMEAIGLEMRNGQKLGPMHICCKRDSYADSLTWALARERENWSVIMQDESLTAILCPPHHRSMIEMAEVAAESDPSVPIQDEQRADVIYHSSYVRPITYDATIENCLNHGLSIDDTDPDSGEVKIVRLITTKTKLSSSVPSFAWSSVHKWFTLDSMVRGVVGRLRAKYNTRAKRKFTDGKLGDVKATVINYLKEVAAEPYQWISYNTLIANLSGLVIRVDPNNSERIQIGVPSPVYEAYLGTDAKLFWIPVSFEE